MHLCEVKTFHILSEEALDSGIQNCYTIKSRMCLTKLYTNLVSIVIHALTKRKVRSINSINFRLSCYQIQFTDNSFKIWSWYSACLKVSFSLRKPQNTLILKALSVILNSNLHFFRTPRFFCIFREKFTITL